MTSALRGTELTQRLGFDLANPFARDVEFLADLFERVLTLTANSETKPDDLLFFRREGLENVRGLVANIGIDDGVNRPTNPSVFCQVTERGFPVAAHRRFERDRVTGDGLQLLDLLDGNVHAPADFIVGRHAPQLFFELAGGAQKLIHALVHVNGNADGA